MSIFETYPNERIIVSENLPKRLYIWIRLAQLIARLEHYNELYANGNNVEYQRNMGVLTSDLQRFRNFIPQTGLPEKIQEALRAKNTTEVLELSYTLLDHLNELYYKERAGNPSTSRRFRQIVVVLVITITAILVVSAYKPLKKVYMAEQVEYRAALYGDEFKQKTVNDILELKEAINNYYNDHKSYPKSSGGWDAIKASYGKSKKDWIPGLAPRYIKQLPVDPRRSDNPGQQYMYKSDGKNYKLIAHNPLGMKEIITHRPELVDPVRSSWAFGIWSEGAKNW